MGTTYANGVWSPARKDPIELHVLAGIMGSAASNAISGRGSGRRQPQEFTAANQAEKVLIEGLFIGGLIEGDRVYLTDTKWWETFTAQGIWSLTETTAWVPYTLPSGGLLNMTIGDGTAWAAYFVKEGRVTVSGYVDLGTTGTMGSAVYSYFPGPPSLRGLTGQSGVLGSCSVIGPSGELYYGVVYSRGEYTFRASMQFKNSSLSGGNRAGLQTGVPRDWSTGTANRQLSVLFSYTPA